jgi:hypothetical protein
MALLIQETRDTIVRMLSHDLASGTSRARFRFAFALFGLYIGLVASMVMSLA